ncbi:MAG: uroporphyrinogen decarboxylase family protein [Desulfatibacillaceae bacterium]
MDVIAILQELAKGRPPPVGEVPGPLLDVLASLEARRGRVSTLSSIERVLTTVRHKQPDRVPVTPILNAGARHIAGVSFPEYSTSPEKAADVFCAGLDFVGGDIAVILLDLSVEAADFGQEIVYPEDSTARPNYLNPKIRSVDDYAKVRPVSVFDGGRMHRFVRLCGIMADRCGWRKLVSGFVFAPLGVLSMMRGAENLFKDCLTHPREVMRACEAVTETLVEFVELQCDAGVGGIAIDTLYASRSALPKDVWERIEGPFAREIARAIRKKGRMVGIHNCGHAPYFDAQCRSMDPLLMSYAHVPDDCADFREMKRRYGHMTFIGHVPTPLLVSGTPHEVMEECRRQIEMLGRDGGYILAPGCEYPPNISIVNAIAMVRAAEEYS